MIFPSCHSNLYRTQLLFMFKLVTTAFAKLVLVLFVQKIKKSSSSLAISIL